MKILNYDEFLLREQFDRFFKIADLGLKEKIEAWLAEMQIQNYEVICDKKNYNDEYIINVNGNVNLSMCNLIKLPYKFNRVLGCFNISCNNLISLENCPDYIEGSFDCSYNTKLKSLKGGPKVVKLTYNCSWCDLRSLDGAPTHVFNFYCFGNKNLKSLRGGPKYVKYKYDCSYCGLETIENAPDKLEVFDYYENPIKFHPHR